MALYILMLITLLSIVFAAYYLVRLPSGPACPRCGTLTESKNSGTQQHFNFLERFRTEDASCPGCGWTGRMRRAPRPQLARVSARGRRS